MYALLEFIIHVQLKEGKSQKEEQTMKLNEMAYSHLITCLVSTKLLQKIVQLPMLIDINNKQEESIIRLCLKLLISIIFKGQNSAQTFSA